MQKFASLFMVVAFLVQAPGVSFASSCRNEVTEQIRFARGAICWTYSGTATHFVGRFSARQKVAIRMTGIVDEYDPKSKSITSSWAARQPSLEGPGGFYAEAPALDESGKLDIVLPKSGQYRFGFYPCAMWHQQGKVEICATH
ncbi:MAG: hypothetical protein ABUL48_00940 [Pseudorhodoplanes sp.]